MTSIAISERPRVSLRPLALPAEHGGWGFLFEPILLGLAVAPSSAGAMIAVAAVAAFLARHPLKLATQDWLRRKRYPRTRACELLAAGYGVIACLFLAMAPLHAVAMLASAIPFGLTQFVYDVRNRGRAFTPELSGVIAPGAIASAIALAGGKPLAFALTLWLLIVLRAIPSILYVRSALRGSSRAVMIGAHVIAIGLAAWIAPVAAIAMLLLLIRAIPSTNGIAARTIGIRELGWGALTVTIVAIAMIAT